MTHPDSGYPQGDGMILEKDHDPPGRSGESLWDVLNDFAARGVPVVGIDLDERPW